MVFTLIGGISISSIRVFGSSAANAAQQETRKEIKARLLKLIRAGKWDPYSADMSIEEFYALMELFEEGKLPIKSDSSAGSPGISAPGFDEPGIEEPSTGSSGVTIPRSMFMFSGLNKYSGANMPLEYNNISGAADEYENYPEGLDPYAQNFMRPPKDWGGVPVNNNSEAMVIVPNANINNPAIAGDVDQTLFLGYEGYYIRRVTAQNTDVIVLGAIRLPDTDEYVYYYLTSDSQNTDVSTTTLPKGQKFIIHYSLSEHIVDYKLFMNSINSVASLPAGVGLDSVFGADRPIKTEDGRYAFTATVPYGYTLELFLIKEEDEASQGNPIVLLGFDSPGTYDSLNEGWALGKEPDYFNGTAIDATILPNLRNAPSKLTVSGTIHNNDVHHNRTVIGVLREKSAPTFLVAPLKFNTDHVSNRGTSAITTITAKNNVTGVTETIPYDYEDVYLWASGKGSSKYDYTNSSFGGASKANLQAGNIATGDSWGWRGKEPYINTVAMNKETDGSYSYQWTWQTNNSDGGFTMDSLEINGVGITLPFYPKYTLRTDYKTGTNGGGTSWYTETDIDNGIHIKVELFMVFNQLTQQRVYRITATGARSNVVISGMNLIMGQGAPEFSAYKLDGVTDGTGTSSVEYYINSNAWRSISQGTIAVNHDENGVNVGINFAGDSRNHYANIRFKLADGYDSPYYLWENPQIGIVEEQASIDRNPLTGDVIPDTKRSVKPLSEASGALDSHYIYGPDDEGYYYIRVSTQMDYKFVLLTVGALPVRYVVRYVPSYKSVNISAPADSDVGIIDNPKNMPEFTHYGDTCHESFRDPTNNIPDEQYDDKDGAYYDTAVDRVIVLPSSIPTDPNSNYIFVDWVLVDNNYAPVIDENGNELRYRSSNIVLADINQYAIKNEELGGDNTDVYVLRLMPTWRKIENPFNYKVALRWVNALGEVNEEYFQGDWRDVLTDWDLSNGELTVKVIKDAVPFLDWIAQHPTYTFWDEVNNAVNDDEIRNALNGYAPSTIDRNGELYNYVLDVMLKKDVNGKNGDDFIRIGGYAYLVKENDGTIVVWMYENKGGLVFHKDVSDEPFTPDDEFFFTVTDVTVEANHKLNSTYKAFPEHVYNANGTEREVLDSDAWIVTFKNGSIESIVKDGVNYGNYFRLKNGEGIRLYVPAGKYTIAELGSKSGGAYNVVVEYRIAGDSLNPEDSWEIPEGDLWLKGSSTDYINTKAPGFTGFPDNISQVSATVDFDIGEHDVVQTLIFSNRTSSLSIEKALGGDMPDAELKRFQAMYFTFEVSLRLPTGYTPLLDSSNKYYFSMNVYNAADGSLVPGSPDKIFFRLGENENGVAVWQGSVRLKPGQRAAIVMTVPTQDDGSINYWVEEVDVPDELTPIWSGKTGKAMPGVEAKIKATNWYGELPGNGFLAIHQTDGDPSDNFLYLITDSEGNKMIVSVKGGGETVVECPSGTYTITEITEWAWRYEDGECFDPPTGTKSVTVTVTGGNKRESPVDVYYKNDPNDKKWLGGESSKDNVFNVGANNISAFPAELKKKKKDN
ncbi:MAG: hypothetical protein J1E34_02870 [Oscillospiraceae bacterium]|nr:hypothetical protein [Oscillospiraceae bacterium]